MLTALTIILGLGERRDFSRPRWLLLLGLRLTALLLLTLWLGGVRLAMPGPGVKRTEIIVLIDGSRSMLLPQGQGLPVRWNGACRLADQAPQWFPKSKVTALVLAGESLVPYRGGDLKNPSEHTDLELGLSLSMSLKPAAVLLLSDGNHNRGQGPLGIAAGSVPIHVCGLGPREAGAKPVISDLYYPAETEMGRAVVLRAWLKGNIAGGTIQLKENGKTLALSKIKGPADSLATLEFVPGERGLHKYDLVLKGPDGSKDNRTLNLAVVKTVFRIACLAGEPVWDLKFLRQAMQSSPAYDPDSYLWKNKRWISEDRGKELHADSLGNYDLFVLFGPGEIGQELQQQIRQLVISKGKGILFWGGWPGSGFLSGLRPLNCEARESGMSGVASADQGLSAAGLLNGPQSRNMNRLPPISPGKTCVPASTEVLLLSTLSLPGGIKVPWWALRYCQAGRSAQFAVTDLWKWQLAAAGAGRDTTVYNSVVLGTLDWLLGKAGGGITAGPERVIYQQGQETAFKGRWEGYREKEDRRAIWTVDISGPEGMKRSLKLVNWGRGDFRAAAGKLKPGEYNFSTALVNDGPYLYKNSGKLWVVADNNEEHDVIQNTKLLKDIARVSGGDYWDPGNDQSRPDWRIPEVIDNKTRDEGFGTILLLTSILLGLEWFLRRRWGRF